MTTTTGPLTLDDAVAFFRRFVEADAAAHVAWRLDNDPAAVAAACALLWRAPQGSKAKHCVMPQPWGSGSRSYKPSADDVQQARASLAQYPVLPRRLYAVELRQIKDVGLVAFAWASPGSASSQGVEKRLAAARIGDDVLLVQTATATGESTSWVGAIGMELKGAGKLVAARRLEEPPAHDPFHAAWSKLPAA